MKLKSFNIFKKILDDEKSNFVKNNKKKIVKSSKNTIFPVNDLVNTIDTPFVILDKNYKVNFRKFCFYFFNSNPSVLRYGNFNFGMII